MKHLRSDKKIVQYYYYLRFKFKKFNIVLHSLLHDIQSYNKTLRRRRENQIRDTLRVEEVYYQTFLLEEDVYNNVLTCYRESHDINTNIFVQTACKCTCHTSKKRPVFHNANCVSKCEASNVSYKNHLLRSNNHINQLFLDSPLIEKEYDFGKKIGLSGETVFTENSKSRIYDCLSSIFSQAKDAISPKIDTLMNFNKKLSKKRLEKDNETGIRCFESIKILHSSKLNFDHMGYETYDFIRSYHMMTQNSQENQTKGEASSVTELLFDMTTNEYVLDVISI